MLSVRYRAFAFACLALLACDPTTPTTSQQDPGTLGLGSPGDSAATLPATTVGAPGRVSDLAIAGATDTSLTVTFTRVPDGNSGTASYDIRFSTTTFSWGSASSVSRGTCASPIAGGAVGTKATCTILGLAATTSYQVELVAFRGTLNLNAVFGPLSNIASGSTAASKPGAVTDLAVSGVTDTSMTLSFTDASGGAGQPASYDVRYALRPLTWWLASSVARGTCGAPVSGTVDGPKRSCTILGLTPSTTYDVQLVSFRGTLNVNAVFGPLSNVAGATTAAPAVASVTVTPGAASITVGATAQFSAVLKDAAGRTLTGRTVTWSSTSPVVGSVTSAGLASALASGSTTISAQSEGRSGSATLAVAPPPSECAISQPAWIWCDDFEQNRTADYFEYDSNNGNFARNAGTGVNGSIGMSARYLVGQSSAGALHLAFGRTPSAYFRPVDAGTANYREIYWRVYLKNQPGWSGGGGDKLGRAIVFANSGWAEAAIGHVWSGLSGTAAGQYLMIDPTSGTDASGNLMTNGYNDFENLRWLGARSSILPLFDAAHVGQWYCVEAHMRLNTAGNADGVLEIWVDGTLQAQSAGLNFLGSFSQYGINALYLENYWNSGPPINETRSLDNFVVSTAPVGCASTN